MVLIVHLVRVVVEVQVELGGEVVNYQLQVVEVLVGLVVRVGVEVAEFSYRLKK